MKVFTLKPVELLSFNDFEHLAFTNWKTIPQELESRYNNIKATYTYNEFDYILTVKWSDDAMTDYYIQEKELIENE